MAQVTAPPATSWHHTVAGGVAGTVAVLFLHPFDVIKTRLQVQDGAPASLTGRQQYRGPVDAFWKVYRTEGWRALYNGLTPAWIGSGVSWSAYMAAYERIKAWHLSRQPDVERLSTGMHMLSAAEAGCAVSLLTNPVWLIKTRLALQQQPQPSSAVATPQPAPSAAAPSPSATAAATLRTAATATVVRIPASTATAAGAVPPLQHVAAEGANAGKLVPYKGMVDAFIRIGREEGLRGYYKGMAASVVLQTTHGAVQFAVYEELKYWAASLKSPASSAPSSSPSVGSSSGGASEHPGAAHGSGSTSGSSSSSTATSRAIGPYVTSNVVSGNDDYREGSSMHLLSSTSNPVGLSTGRGPGDSSHSQSDSSHPPASSTSSLGSMTAATCTPVTSLEKLRHTAQNASTAHAAHNQEGHSPTAAVLSTAHAARISSTAHTAHAARNQEAPTPPADVLSTLELSLCAAASKFVASVTTYPTQLVRSRLQQRMEGRELPYTNTLQVIRLTWSREGLRGFYKGLVPALFRVMPQSAVTLVAYEHTLRFLEKRRST